MADFLIPTALALSQIEQNLLPRLQAQRLINKYMPIETEDASEISWEQEDDYVGLQQLRGLNGAPPKVTRTGAKRYSMVPGAYGEYSLVDEYELTKRRAYGQLTQLIDTRELVAKEQVRLAQRELDRIESIGWTLFATGTFSVSSLSGAVAHTDSYTMQTYSASVSWGTAATATPLADLRAIQLLSVGHSVQFNAQSEAIMNRKTANKLFANTNAADIYGRRTQGLGTFNSPAQINELLTGDDLPMITIYDQGYLDDTNTFQRYIPDNKVIVMGQRTDGGTIAAYKETRNVNNDGEAPGGYFKVFDRGASQVPRSIEIHRGHNGGPVIYFPSAVVVASV